MFKLKLFININRSFVYLTFFFLVISCNEKKTKINYPIKEVSVIENPAEGGSEININLSITGIEKDSFATRYHVISSFKTDTIGFLLRIPNRSVDSTGYGVGIRFSSLGKESDNFLHFLFTTYSNYYIMDTLKNYSFAPMVSFAYYDVTRNKTGNTHTFNLDFADSLKTSVLLSVDTIFKNVTFSNNSTKPLEIIKKFQSSQTEINN